MTFRIEMIDPVADQRWDDAVLGLGGSVYHFGGWARTLRDTYRYRPHFLWAREGENVRAVLPLMEINSWLTGRRGVSLPFSDECPAIGDATAFQALFDAAVEMGARRRWKYLELRTHASSLIRARTSLSFYGHTIDLGGSETEQFSRLDSSSRRAVRKAMQDGVAVRFGCDVDAMKTFYTLLCKSRQRLGVPPQPWSFFRNLLIEIQCHRSGQIATAWRNGTPLAAALFLHGKQMAVYKYAASDSRFQQHRANNLLIWEAMRRYAGEGYIALDLGRTSTTNDGLREFKQRMSGTERLIEYVKYDFTTGTFVSDTDHASGWHNRFFRALPISVARPVGAALYRHVA